jgi:4-amino-4-deoxy-L-arabinose transferase-like glycosyltransferase
MRRPGRFGGRIAVFALAALAIRLIYILVIAPEPVGVGGDASFYHSAANLIADGHFYYRRIFGHAYPTALHPPLYSLLLSLVALVGGVHLLPQRIVGCVVGSISVALIGILGRRIAAERTTALAAERTGLAACAIAAVYPPFISADGSVMSEPLYVLIVIVALLAAIGLVDRPGPRRALVLGGVIGLGILTRTEALLLMGLLAWPAAFGRRPGRTARIAAVTIGAVLVVSPWIIRNVVVFHRFTLATNYDTVIAGANCRDTYYGHDIGWWSISCVARSRTHHQLLIGDASTAAGIRYARRHPTRSVLVAGVRVLRTFSFYQPLRLGNNEPRRRWVDAAGLVVYYPLLLLACVGVALLPGRRWLLLAPLCSVLIIAATGWGNGRFRIGGEVSLVVLGALALTNSRALSENAPRVGILGAAAYDHDR